MMLKHPVLIHMDSKAASRTAPYPMAKREQYLDIRKLFRSKSWASGDDGIGQLLGGFGNLLFHVAQIAQTQSRVKKKRVKKKNRRR